MRRVILFVSLVSCSAAPVTPLPSVSSTQKGFEVEAVSGLGLFSDELSKSRVLLADEVLKRGQSVLPFEVTDRAWALAAQGRNPLTGAECGRPLGSYQARKRWGSAIGLTGNVSSNVWCEADGGCVLHVSGRPLDDEDAEDRFRWETEIAPTGDSLGALATAVTKLAPPKPGESGMAGIFGAMGGMRPIQETDLLEVNIWPADQRDRTRVDDDKSGFPSLTLAQVQTCLGTDDDSVQTLVEISASGAIGRCEGDPSEAPAAASCMCGQLKKSTPAAWLAGKRWSVSVRIDRRDQTTSDRRFVLEGSWTTYLQMVKVKGESYPRFKPKVEDPSIDDWSTGPTRLATSCFTNAFTKPGNLDSRWAVWFDAVGRPTKIVEQKGHPPLTKELAECVARALRTAQAPCPSRAGLWAMADLHVNARDPNVPQPSLNDLLNSKEP